MVLHWSSSSSVVKILAKCEWSNSFLVLLLQFKSKANLLKITPLHKFFKGVNNCFIEQLWMASSSSYFWLCSFKELQSAKGWWKFTKNVLVFFDYLLMPYWLIPFVSIFVEFFFCVIVGCSAPLMPAANLIQTEKLKW